MVVVRRGGGPLVGIIEPGFRHDGAVDTVTDRRRIHPAYDAAGARVWRAHGTDSTRYIAGMVERDLDTGTTSGWRSLYGFGGTPVAVQDHTADTVVYPMGDR